MKTFFSSLILLSSLALAQDSTDHMRTLNTPRWVIDLFHSSGMDSIYRFSFRINPSYLRGDFDGDGGTDVVALITNKAKAYGGFAIFSAKKAKVFIVGADSVRSDFNRMDVWGVLPKELESRLDIKGAQGEVIYVLRTESEGGGHIYWSGQSFLWRKRSSK